MENQTPERVLASTSSTSNYTTEKQSVLHQFVHWIVDSLDKAE